MYREGTRLVMELDHCYKCNGSGSTEETVRMACSTCAGTGKGVRGGRGGCKNCHGLRSMNVTVPDSSVPCARCEGVGGVMETLYDTLSEDVWKSFDFRVVRTNRGQGFVESHIGVGCYSSTDYGDAWKANDPQGLIAKVRDGRGSTPQAIKVARYLCPRCGEVGKPRWTSAYADGVDAMIPQGLKMAECGHPNPPEVWEDSNEVADAVVINVHPRGYTVLGVFYERSAGREDIVETALV